MMPLTYANIGEENIIKRIGGANETKHHLKNLGFVPGSKISIVNRINKNVIVNIKDTRIAISEELAQKIMI